MATAFEDLGLKNYDYPEQFMYSKEDWMKIFAKGGTTDDFRRMFENCDSVTDSPACYFWYEILQAYPDAKVFTFHSSIFFLRFYNFVYLKTIQQTTSKLSSF